MNSLDTIVTGTILKSLKLNKKKVSNYFDDVNRY